VTETKKLSNVADRVQEGLRAQTFKASFITLNAPLDWTQEDIDKFSKIFSADQMVSRWTSGRIGFNGTLAWRIPIVLNADGTFSDINHELFAFREVK
jgi:hypothetical protein